MGKTAPDRATVADLVMRDVRDGRVQQRMRRHQPLIVLDVAPADERAEPQAVIADGDIAEPGQPPEITSRLGVARRKARTGIRLCPPAMTNASGFDASRSIASRRLLGAW
jgi:hypothetical protein